MLASSCRLNEVKIPIHDVATCTQSFHFANATKCSRTFRNGNIVLVSACANCTFCDSFTVYTRPSMSDDKSTHEALSSKTSSSSKRLSSPKQSLVSSYYTSEPDGVPMADDDDSSSASPESPGSSSAYSGHDCQQSPEASSRASSPAQSPERDPGGEKELPAAPSISFAPPSKLGENDAAPAARGSAASIDVSPAGPAASPPQVPEGIDPRIPLYFPIYRKQTPI